MPFAALGAEFTNLAATVLGQPTKDTVDQLSGNPTIGSAFPEPMEGTMPSATADHVRRALLGGGSPRAQSQTYLGGMLYQAGLLPSDGNPDSGVTGIAGDLYQHAVDAIDVFNNDPLTVISQLSWPGTATAVMGTVLDVFGQHVPAIGTALANLPDGTKTTMVQDILAGNVGGLAADAVVGVLLPYLAEVALGVLARQTGISFGMRPPQPQLTEYYWPHDVAATATRTPPSSQVNVGHAGHMSVKLGKIPFEIPPAIATLLPIHGGVTGQVTPGAMPGIQFKHIQNYATLLIPGGAPVYQSLGIQGLMIEFVGAFLGFDPGRLLNSDLHQVGFNDPYNPDPLYTEDSDATLSTKAGSWGVSRKFLDNVVKTGVDQDFEIFSGVVRIQYKVIVINFERWYRDDARTFYKFQCLAVGGVEGGSDSDTTLSRRAPTKTELKANQDKTAGDSSGNISRKAPLVLKSSANPDTSNTSGGTTRTAAPNPATYDAITQSLQSTRATLELAQNGYDSLTSLKDQELATKKLVVLANTASAEKAINRTSALLDTYDSQTNAPYTKDAVDKQTAHIRSELNKYRDQVNTLKLRTPAVKLTK